MPVGSSSTSLDILKDLSEQTTNTVSGRTQKMTTKANTFSV
jgi:hypothetical protein